MLFRSAGGDADRLASVLQGLELEPKMADGLVLEGLFLIDGEAQ